MSEIDSTYAWSLLAEEVGPAVPPSTPSCNVSFSPVSLHAAASFVAAGSSVSSSTSADHRRILLSSLASSGFGSPIPREAAYYAIKAVRSDRGVYDEDEIGAWPNVISDVLFRSALWSRDYLAMGENNLTAETRRSAYGCGDIHSNNDFKTKADEAREKANSWLRELFFSPSPKDLIAPESVHGDTEFIACNVLIFMARWAPEIGLEIGTCSDFYQIDGRKMSVPFMTSKKPQRISTYYTFKVLRLPYRRGKDGDKRRFAMYIFLPHKRYGLFELLNKFATEDHFLENHFPKEMVGVGEFRLPVKEVTVASQAVATIWPPSPLAAQGEEERLVDPAYLPFQPQCFSDFYFLDCEDEDDKGKGKGKGKEKEKAIDDVMDISDSFTFTHVDFVADHSFLYSIREDTSGTVVMVGYVYNPVCGNPKFQHCKKEHKKARAAGGGAAN